MNILKIDPDLQNHYSNLVTNQFKKLDLYRKLQQDKNRPTADEVLGMDAIEQFVINSLCVYDMFGAECRQDLRTAFALHAAAQEALRLLPKAKVKPFRVNLDFKTNITTLLFSDIVIEEFYNRRSDDVLSIYATAFFNSIAQQAQALARTYLEESKEFENQPVMVGKTVVIGFRSESTDEKDEKPDVDETAWLDVIGSEDIIRDLQSIVDDLLCYDPDTGRNPVLEVYSLPGTILLYGVPGTGKTTILKALINDFYTRAIALGKAKPKVIKIDSNFKSKFQGESAANLTAMFKQANDQNAIAIVLMEDLDSFFPSRDELTNEPEAKQVFGAILNLIQGLSTQNRGNNIIIATTNKPETLDPALRQRFNILYEMMGPSCPDDLAKIAKLKLNKKLKFLKVDDSTLDKFGAEAFASKYTGRDVDNIVQMFVSETISLRRPKIPAEFYKLDYNDKVKWLTDSYGKSGASLNGEILQTLSRYQHLRTQQQLLLQNEQIQRIRAQRRADKMAAAEE